MKRVFKAFVLVSLCLALLGLSSSRADAYYQARGISGAPYYPQYANPILPMQNCNYSGMRVGGVHVMGLPGYGTQAVYAVVHMYWWNGSGWQQFYPSNDMSLHTGGYYTTSGSYVNFESKWFNLTPGYYYTVNIEVDWHAYSNGARIDNAWYGPQYASELAGTYRYSGNPAYCYAA